MMSDEASDRVSDVVGDLVTDVVTEVVGDIALPNRHAHSTLSDLHNNSSAITPSTSHAQKLFL
jgi:hypothetical protein